MTMISIYYLEYYNVNAASNAPVKPIFHKASACSALVICNKLHNKLLSQADTYLIIIIIIISDSTDFQPS